MSFRFPLDPARLLALALSCAQVGCARERATEAPTVGVAPIAATAPMPETGALRAPAEPTWVAPAVKPIEGVEGPAAGERQLVLAAVGDVLLHGPVQASAEALEGRYRALFASIEPELQAPHLTFANLETPISPEGAAAGAMSFNAPAEVLDALRDVGVDVVSVANNHIFDRGRRGLDATLEHLAAARLSAVGAGIPPQEAGPLVLEAEDIRVGFLAWTQVLNREFTHCRAGKPCAQVAVLREWAPALAQVREVAPQVDLLVVSLHWGIEYALQPGEDQRTFAKLLVQAGADVVLGHHPHVPQQIEVIRRKDGSVGVVAYSLGNLISNQSRGYRAGKDPKEVGATRDGVLLRVAAARTPEVAGAPRSRARLVGMDALQLWTENRVRAGDLPAIEVVATDTALATVQQSLVSATGTERRGLLNARRLYAERQAFMREVLGESMLRAPGPLTPGPKLTLSSD